MLHINEPCHKSVCHVTYQCIMSRAHTCKDKESVVSHINSLGDTSFSHVTHQRLMSHMHESCHISHLSRCRSMIEIFWSYSHVRYQMPTYVYTHIYTSHVTSHSHVRYEMPIYIYQHVRKSCHTCGSCHTRDRLRSSSLTRTCVIKCRPIILYICIHKPCHVSVARAL